MIFFQCNRISAWREVSSKFSNFFWIWNSLWCFWKDGDFYISKWLVHFCLSVLHVRVEIYSLSVFRLVRLPMCVCVCVCLCVSLTARVYLSERQHLCAIPFRNILFAVKCNINVRMELHRSFMELMLSSGIQYLYASLLSTVIL